jgi:hypothetical protein
VLILGATGTTLRVLQLTGVLQQVRLLDGRAAS